MKAGDHVQTITHIVGSKKNVYAIPLDLLTITSVDFLPVLIVRHYGKQSKFPVHINNVTTELHPKHKAQILKDQKPKQNGSKKL